MSSYTVEILPRARRKLKQIPKKDAARVLAKIESLADDPRPHGYKKLEYYTEHFRVRVGNFRIIYQIEHVIRIVTVAQVTDRRDAY